MEVVVDNEKMKHDVPTRLVKVLILILMMVAFGFVWYGYYAARAQVHYYRRGDWVVILLFGILYYGFCRSYDAFHISISPISEIIYSQTLALIIPILSCMWLSGFCPCTCRMPCRF